MSDKPEALWIESTRGPDDEPACLLTWGHVPARKGSWRSVSVPADVVFGDGELHPVMIVARWVLADGRPVIQLQWDDPVTETWTEYYIEEPGKVTEL